MGCPRSLRPWLRCDPCADHDCGDIAANPRPSRPWLCCDGGQAALFAFGDNCPKVVTCVAPLRLPLRSLIRRSLRLSMVIMTVAPLRSRVRRRHDLRDTLSTEQLAASSFSLRCRLPTPRRRRAGRWQKRQAAATATTSDCDTWCYGLSQAGRTRGGSVFYDAIVAMILYGCSPTARQPTYRGTDGSKTDMANPVRKHERPGHMVCAWVGFVVRRQGLEPRTR